MARKSTSQWDFGDLFAGKETRAVMSVAELTQRIKSRLESEFQRLWVSGEISNLRLQSSGHMYFVLKDATAQLSCVLFRGQSGVNRGLIADGMKVLLGGQLTVYEPRGQYQMRVESVEAQGQGALQLAFERLKARLQAEGLFDSGRKRPIPAYPRTIGLVTSPTGAVLRDIVHVVRRRHAGLEIVLAPSRVQGAGAAEEVAEAIQRLNQWSERARSTGGAGVDVIVLARGGGSLEDLWAFNEEVVARAVAASEAPVISAVGHETDFTIADFVADLRAATPSAAAEILTQGYVDSRSKLAGAGERMRRHVMRARLRWREDMVEWRRRLARAHPRRRVEAQGQRLDEVRERLRRLALRAIPERRRRWQSLVMRMIAVRPGLRVGRQRALVVEGARRVRVRGRVVMDQLRQRLAAAAESLRLLSPEETLKRGYSISMDAGTGRVLRDVGGLGPGRRLKTRLHGGEIVSIVEAVADKSVAREGS